MVERFKREARTAAALSHPHIIPIYAWKESGHVLYFVMKYVQGRALDTVIRDVATLPIPMVQTILAQVGDALGYAHRHGVIHRDIKSANIMLDEDGRAVVTDFGIAKVVQARSEEHTSELQSLAYLVCRLLLEKKKNNIKSPDVEASIDVENECRQT